MPWPWLRRVFGIDLRTLAVFRMALALVLCGDLLERLKNVRVYYTEQGLIPKAAIDQVFGNSVKWTSLHYHTGDSVWLQSLVVGLGVVVAVALFCGYRTRLVTLVSWLLIISLNRRTPSFCTGGDDVMRLLLLWSIFLPLGSRWSLDARRLRQDEETNASVAANRFFSAGTCAILLQVCFIYVFTAIIKFGGSQWLDGTALKTALQFEVHVRPLGVWLSEQNLTLLKSLTFATLFVEFSMPFVAFSPYFHAYARWLAILAMWSLHFGIFVFMTIGIFPFVCMACWVLFIPSETWDWLRSKKGEVNLQPVKKTFEQSFVVTVLVSGMLLFVTIYNILGIEQLNNRGIRIPGAMKKVANVTRLHQKWKMYAPTPGTVDCWFVMPAVLKDGTSVDVFRQQPLTYEKPDVVSESFPTSRIKKLMLAQCRHVNSAVWLWLPKHYAEQWNREHPENPAVRVQSVYVGERTHNDEPYLVPYVEYDLRSGEARKLNQTRLIQTIRN